MSITCEYHSTVCALVADEYQSTMNVVAVKSVPMATRNQRVKNVAGVKFARTSAKRGNAKNVEGSESVGKKKSVLVAE